MNVATADLLLATTFSPAAIGATCESLASAALPNAKITMAQVVEAGKFTAAPNFSNVPAFCRVRGVSKPSADSNIAFEVWLPEPANWNGKFLSSGEGGFAGSLNYTRNGLDGGLDELVRRGYATASTDTGHVASDTWWAVGHP
jgi:feruloyl esterase